MHRAALAALAALATLAPSAACVHSSSSTIGPAEADGAARRIAPAYTATRWVPPRPTYVVAARSVRGALYAAAATIDALGTPFGVGLEDVRQGLRALIHLDLFDLNELIDMGLDLEGGLAVFSDDLEPTVVLHLVQPDRTLAFFDRLRDRGLPTSSTVVDHVEIYTTKLADELHLSWAVADEWLWLHLTWTPHVDAPAKGKVAAPAPAPIGHAWFGPKAGAPTWGARWNGALGAAGRVHVGKGLVGFADVATVIARVLAKRGIPTLGDGLACAKLVAPVERLALAIEAGDGRDRHATATARLGIGIGAAAAAGQGAVLAPPPGWTAAARTAALAGAWNLDLGALATWLGPCARVAGIGALDRVRDLGVRSARAFVEQLDLDKKSGRGAVALDLASAKAIDGYLDQIPMRSTLERARTFGALDGHELSIPFGPTLDYVLSDRLAIAAVGDGLLDTIATGAPAGPAPILAIDLVPARLAEATWRSLLELVGVRDGAAIVQRLMRWDEAHVGLAFEGDELVLEARGKRR